MRTIWKYPVPIVDRFALDIPRDAMLLDVQVQRDTFENETAMLWALVETENPKERTMFAVIGTGNPFPDPDEGEFWHVGTFQMRGSALVWHLFYKNAWGN